VLSQQGFIFLTSLLNIFRLAGDWMKGTRVNGFEKVLA